MTLLEAPRIIDEVEQEAADQVLTAVDNFNDGLSFFGYEAVRSTDGAGKTFITVYSNETDIEELWEDDPEWLTKLNDLACRLEAAAMTA